MPKIEKGVEMNFVCPICEAAVNLPEDNFEYPVTKKMCQSCGTILFVDPVGGNVDAYKSPFKSSTVLKISNTERIDRDKSVLSLSSQTQGAKDWLAIIVVGSILAILIAAVLYFFNNLDIIQVTLQSIHKLIGSFTRSGGIGL
jgi:hypothetical protein